MCILVASESPNDLTDFETSHVSLNKWNFVVLLEGLAVDPFKIDAQTHVDARTQEAVSHASATAEQVYSSDGCHVYSLSRHSAICARMPFIVIFTSSLESIGKSW